MTLIDDIKRGYALKHQQRLTSRDIADAVGVSLPTVARWSASGHIPPVGAGRLRERYGRYLDAAPERMPLWLVAADPGDDEHCYMIRTGRPSAIVKILRRDGKLSVAATEFHGDPAGAAAIEAEAVERLAARLAQTD